MSKLEIIKDAEFSGCRRYRFALWRIWDDTAPKIMFIGLNPSTANEATNDPTIRKVIGFAKKWEFGGVYMLNCFPYISTNPADLNTNYNNSIKLHNDYKLAQFGSMSKEIVFAWGNFPIVKKMKRDSELAEMFPNAKSLLINKNGSPRHPLYVPYSAILVDYR